MKKIYSSVFLLLSLVMISAMVPVTDDVYTLLQKMIAQADLIQGMQYDMKQIERIEGEMLEQKSFVKYDRVQTKIYAKQVLGPSKGAEVLYRKGWNGEKALVNTNGFPWVNVSLSPFGSQMRKDQHHTIMDLGYELIAPVMESMLDSYGKEINTFAKNKGTRTFDGKQVFEIEINNPHFKWKDYVVKKGETLGVIANKKKVSDYMVMMKNKGVDSYSDVWAGQTIKIPSHYAARTILYIDQQTMLPLLLKNYDEKGLFEHYEFLGLKLNPVFASDEFSKGFKGYGF